ncbi:MAG: DUF1616 domain-containing protein [Promethearchaeia archaeon]
MKNKLPPNGEAQEDESSYQSFGQIIKISLILGIIVVSGFIIFYIVNPDPGFVGFGILNSEKKAEDYPTNITVGEDVHFYAYVENHLERPFTFIIKVLKDNKETELSSNGSKNADLNFTVKKTTLELENDWTSEQLSISYHKNGTNRLLILELWEVTGEETEEFYDIVYLRFNVTA